MERNDQQVEGKNDERRIGFERRQYTYTDFIPERRSDTGRRSMDISNDAIDIQRGQPIIPAGSFLNGL